MAKEVKRIALFHHYDNGCMVDDHVLYTLDALTKENIDIIFISMSPVKGKEREKILPYALEIHELPNEGYDWNGWKTILLKKGYEYFSEYDEIILMNDSCYGPVFPLSDFFREMEEKKCDFYGITECKDMPEWPDHIQSYFIALKKNVFSSDAFWKFMRHIKGQNYQKIIRNCEAAFSRTMRDNNFTSAVYCEIPEFEECRPIDFHSFLAFFGPSFLIRQFRLPFVKVKAFSNGYGGIDAHYNKSSTILQALKKFNSPYPIELIDSHLRRTRPLSWHKNLFNNLIVVDGNVPEHSHSHLKIGVFAHLFYYDIIDQIKELSNIPCKFDLMVTTPDEKIYKQIEKAVKDNNVDINNLSVKKVTNRGRDVFAWLDAYKDVHLEYDLALKYKDKKSIKSSPEIGYQWKEFIRDSLIGSRAAVSAILNTFSECGRVGVIFPTYPPVMNFMPFEFNGFPENIDLLDQVMAACGCKYIKDNFTLIFPAGNEFWYRPRALAPLLEHNFDIGDFPEEPLPADGTILHAIERSIPYVAQGNGYEYRLVITREDLVRTFQTYEDYMLRRRNFQESPEGRSLRHQIYNRFSEKFPRLAKTAKPAAKLLYKIYKKLS